MTNLTRKNQKVFASGATNNGQFGSLQATTKVLSSDIETLQALAAYEAGWNSATISGEQLPSLEEFQALNYINTYQSAYLLQKGLPEWVSTATYYDNDIQRGVGNSKLYKSKIDDNINYDVAATAYDGGTTYAIDDVASDTNGDVYRSLTDSNTGNPLSDGSNWELTWEYIGDLSNLVNTSQATETSAGVAEIATQVEVNAGTDDERFITPLKLSGVVGLVPIASAEASDSSSVDFDNFLDDTYDVYKVVMTGVVPAADGAVPYIRVGTGAGPTYQSNTYNAGNVIITQTGSVSGAGGVSATQIAIQHTRGTGNAAGESFSGEFNIYSPSNASLFTNINGSSSQNSNDGVYQTSFFGGAWRVTTAVTSVRIIMATGNITSGKFELYGYKK